MTTSFSQACLLVLLTAFLHAGCASPLHGTAAPETGTYRLTTEIRFNLSARNYLLHIPPRYIPTAPLPLVIVLHGAFSTGRQTEEETGFSLLADQANFIVAYPEGIGIFGLLQHWNAGHCCGKAARDDIDDIAFIDAIIRKTSHMLSVNPDRIYLAGMSNGGMLTYRYAAERAEELAAIAAVSAPIHSHDDMSTPHRTLPEPTAPLSVIAFHGTADEHIPINGGSSPLKSGERQYSSYEQSKRYWHRSANCQFTPVITESHQGAVIKESSSCANGTELTFYTLKNWGHLWPAPYFTAARPEDDPLNNFNATEQIWEFFRQHTRATVPGSDR